LARDANRRFNAFTSWMVVHYYIIPKLINIDDSIWSYLLLLLLLKLLLLEHALLLVCYLLLFLLLLLLLLLLWDRPQTEIITSVIATFYEMPASQLRQIIIRHSKLVCSSYDAHMYYYHGCKSTNRLSINRLLVNVNSGGFAVCVIFATSKIIFKEQCIRQHWLWSEHIWNVLQPN
jgi:hypothetical protein